MATDALTAEALLGRLDRLDSRTRLIVAVALVLAVVRLTSFAALGAAIVAGFGLTLYAGIPPRRTLRRLLHVEGFLLILFVALPLIARDGPFIDIGLLSLSQPGIERALTLVARITAAVLIVLPLVAGLTPIRLGHALGRLGVPSRLTQVFLFAIRYIDLLRAEARRLQDAMRLRGFVPGTNLHTLRSYGHFIGQLLVRAVERAERVDEAMRCRGFRGRFPLVTFERFGAADTSAVLIAAAFIVATFALDRLT